MAAFRATFEETRDAALLVHVIDASAEDRGAQQAAVQEVLSDMGLDKQAMLFVYNKIDACPGIRRVWCVMKTVKLKKYGFRPKQERA